MKQTSTDPRLPHNLDAEKSILAAVLLQNSSIDTTGDSLVPDDFFLPEHRQIFRTMLAMREDAQPIDLVTLMDRLDADKHLGNVGGAGYLSALIDGHPSIPNVAHYAGIVTEKARLRRIIRATEQVQRRALEPGADFDQLKTEFEEIARRHADATPQTNGNGHISYSTVDFLRKDWPAPEALVEGLLSRSSPAMIVAMPHSLKSWFTIALAYACTVPTETALGRLVVRRPIKTMLIQIEESASEIKKRVASILSTSQFTNINQDNVRIIPREEFPREGFTPKWAKKIVQEAVEFKSDLIVFDVLRRFFAGHGDINSPVDSASFLEMMDDIRDATDATTLLVHHKNKKGAEMMFSPAGSMNFAGWAKTLIEFKNKRTKGGSSLIEIEVDMAYGQSAEPMRMVLNLESPMPVRLEALDEGDGLVEAIAEMDDEWTIRTLMEVMDITRQSAQRRIQAWESKGQIRKVKAGKKGRGGLAWYTANLPD